MNRTRDELAEAKRQIESTVGKLRKALESMRDKRDGRRREAQITLAERRIRAFELAAELIGEALEKGGREASDGDGREREEMVRTARLRIHPLSDEEMERMVAAERDAGLKQAYGEMLAGCRANPDGRLWHAVWSIEELGGERVGDLSFKGVSPDGVTELGYGIDEGKRGKGYATEAVKAMAAWAFGHEEIRAVEAETEVGNGASRRVLEKCGFTATGKTGEEGPRFRLGRGETTAKS